MYILYLYLYNIFLCLFIISYKYMVFYNGAGIFIVENYKNNLVAVLFGMQSAHGITEYNEPGGSIDFGEKTEETACRETREETANLIKILPHELLNISTPIIIHKYISYVIYVNKLITKDYYHNVNLIFNECKQHHWKENNSMVRVNLNSLINNAINNINIINDINGNKISVRDRTIEIAKKFNDGILAKLNLPISLNKNITLNSKMLCLIGTNTYTIQQHIPQRQIAIPQKQKYKYAIYVVPNLKGKDKILHQCNKIWSGLHITLVGFSANHPPIEQNLKILSQRGIKSWKIDTSTISITNNTVYIRSKTLNKFAKSLTKNSFQNVKGKRFSGNPWHITFNNCIIPINIANVLKKVSWSFVIVRDNNDETYTWIKKYKIHRI
jgi:hypothetical protein